MGQLINPASDLGRALERLNGGADETTGIVRYTPDFWVHHAITEIYDSFGEVVEVKPKSLVKFGQFINLGDGFETVQSQGGNEDYQTANTIDTVSSTDASASAVVVIEGQTVDDSGNFTFVEQSLALNGQAKVALSTPLARCTRVCNASSPDFFGDVYVYRDGATTGGVPDDAATIHAVALATDQQTEKCSTTISSADYWIVTKWQASVNRRNTASVDFKLQIRRKNSVFRTAADLSLSNASGSHEATLRPYLIVPRNSDVRVVASSSASGTSVSAAVGGVLCTIKADTDGT